MAQKNARPSTSSTNATAPASSALTTFLKKAPAKAEGIDAGAAVAKIDAAAKSLRAKDALEKALEKKAKAKAVAKATDDGCGCWGEEEEEADGWD